MLHRVSQVFKTCGVATFLPRSAFTVVVVWMNWGSPDGSPDAMTDYLRTREVSCQEQIVQGQEKKGFGASHQTSFSGTSAARRDFLYTFECKECGPLAANVGRLPVWKLYSSLRGPKTLMFQSVLFYGHTAYFLQEAWKWKGWAPSSHDALGPRFPTKVHTRQKNFIVASFSNSIIVQLSTAGTWGPGSHPRSLLYDFLCRHYCSFQRWFLCRSVVVDRKAVSGGLKDCFCFTFYPQSNWESYFSNGLTPPLAILVHVGMDGTLQEDVMDAC